MPLYRVALRGENYLLNLTGEPQLLGFDVTHYVKAASEEEAERKALILTRSRRDLQSALLNSRENPTRLNCQAIKRVRLRRSRHDGVYAFFDMDASPLPDAGATGESPNR